MHLGTETQWTQHSFFSGIFSTPGDKKAEHLNRDQPLLCFEDLELCYKANLFSFVVRKKKQTTEHVKYRQKPLQVSFLLQ